MGVLSKFGRRPGRAAGFWAAAALAGLSLLGPAACRSASSRSGARKAAASPYPHESVMSALAELKIHLRRDAYRYPPGEDLDGRNIFRVTLARLESLDELTGPEFDDVIAFARGECLERLGLWSAAGESFGAAAAKGTSLAAAAKLRQGWAGRVGGALADPSSELTLEQYLGMLDAGRLALEALRGAAPPEPYGALLRVELERVARVKAVFLAANRQILPQGTERALGADDALIAGNAESWRRGENLILLGRVHEQLACEYAAAQDPTRAGFDFDKWGRWVQNAREAYLKAAQADGDPAKPEAQARLRALDAFSQRVLAQAR